MPYKSIEQLPSGVKNHLPVHAQEIYKDAFNDAEQEYGTLDQAAKVAWHAVKENYEKKEDGQWIAKA